jgi:hypothetical protein
MNDPSFVTAAQRQQQLDQPVQNLFLRQIGANGLARAQMRMQISARAVLHDDVQRILLQEGLAIANDEGVRFRTAQPLQRLHFAQRGQTLGFRQCGEWNHFEHERLASIRAFHQLSERTHRSDKDHVDKREA